MKKIAYAIETGVEASHWWFVARRRLIAAKIRELGIQQDMPVLDVGSGTGTNLRLLQALGFRDVMGVDNSDEAIRFCAEKGLGPVRKGDICRLPFDDGQFAFILATDIIEHVDDDVAALAELRRTLVPGGIALITVPAFESLWGIQDEVSIHKRRYRLRELKRQIEAAGLKLKKAFHFNYLLFIPIWLARVLMRLMGIRPVSENLVNTPLLNRILLFIFTLDVVTAERIRPPFGVSILAVAEKTEDRSHAAA